VVVLLSQNRQVARDRVRNDIEYDVNLKAESEVAHLHEVIDDLRVELLEKLEQLAGRPG
jgi:CRP/FNR family cyclic AMP-dependent transcriptional regulator